MWCVCLRGASLRVDGQDASLPEVDVMWGVDRGTWTDDLTRYASPRMTVLALLRLTSCYFDREQFEAEWCDLNEPSLKRLRLCGQRGLPPCKSQTFT